MITDIDKKRDSKRTRLAILRAAQHVFSSRPYSEASLKDICKAAGANVALVSRYFGSKEMLFEEALAEALDVTMLMPANRDTFGESLARAFTTDHPGRLNPLPMLVYASAHSSLRDSALRLLNERVLSPFGAWIGGPDGNALAAQVMAIATGYFTFRLILPLEPFSAQVEDVTEHWLATSLQQIIARA